MSFLLKNKYEKYSIKLNELDYDYINLIEQCKKDIAEVQYMPLNEYQQNRCKRILNKIISKSNFEREEIQRASDLVESALKSLDKDSLGEIDINLPVKEVIRYGSKHVKDLKAVHGEVLDSFEKGNLEEKAIRNKIYDDSEREI